MMVKVYTTYVDTAQHHHQVQLTPQKVHEINSTALSGISLTLKMERLNKVIKRGNHLILLYFIYLSI
jgi:hypothetical protein